MGKPKIHILDCCSFVSYFPFWRELLLIPNSTSSETVHQQTGRRGEIPSNSGNVSGGNGDDVGGSRMPPTNEWQRRREEEGEFGN